jgi:hypothetical protein
MAIALSYAVEASHMYDMATLLNMYSAFGSARHIAGTRLYAVICTSMLLLLPHYCCARSTLAYFGIELLSA